MIVDLDLSIPTLMRACKGDVRKLPSFMVHDNRVWPAGVVRLDAKNRIHLRRSTFLDAVAKVLPVKEGIWLGVDVQEFTLDLKPHHLQGGDAPGDATGYKHSREIIKADAWGRVKGDAGYGETDTGPDGRAANRSDIAAAARNGARGGIRSSVFDRRRS